METRHFITVDWCSKGNRGIFCDRDGKAWSQNKPYTEKEMDKILGLLSLILVPKSVEFTREQVAEYVIYRPMEEFQNFFGVAIKE